MSQPASVTTAAQAFRKFFSELRDTYLEREAVFTQIELALLCREHVLIIGPPGTAKSAIAAAVLARIVDEKTGAPSLFAKQLSESTVQTDLIGPVDFKVLTETGRTEFLTDDGMLGATYGFLDEVFDGRDMLLRSILNVLHERELKHGRRVTAGRLETAIMTSNRYLSEVLARSPELLLAFADRLSFVCFVPKSFARPSSRAAMMTRFSKGQRPDLRAELAIQQLDVLQELVDRVEVPSTLMEALELLTDELERLLQAQVARLPDYVPTKYFSQRSVVKALWALKAAVVRDRIYRAPDRPLEATDRDLEALRYFFLLGGPPPPEAEAMLKSAVDPRERAQLEILRLEHRAFDEALAKIRTQAADGVQREAALLKPADELVTAEGLARSYAASTASTLARSLRQKLVPGPRHPQNREPLLASARALVAGVERRVTRGLSAKDERGGAAVLASFGEVLELCRAVPELHARGDGLSTHLLSFAAQALDLAAAAVDGAHYDAGLRLDGIAQLAGTLHEDLTQVQELLAVVETVAGAKVNPLREKASATRRNVAAALARRATSAFEASRTRKGVDPYDALTADSRFLGAVEARLAALDPDQQGFRQALLAPLGQNYARQVLATTAFERVEQFALAVQMVSENLRKHGIDPGPTLAAVREVIEERMRAHAAALGRDRPPVAPSGNQVLSGEAYTYYRNELAGPAAPDGELVALTSMETHLGAPPDAGALLSQAVKDAVAQAELSSLHQRVAFLRGWVAQLVTALPDPTALREREEAEKVFDRLVRSRLPMLAMKEGELVRLQASLGALSKHPGQVGEGARALERMLHSVSDVFGEYSKRLLEARASL